MSEKTGEDKVLSVVNDSLLVTDAVGSFKVVAGGILTVKGTLTGKIDVEQGGSVAILESARVTASVINRGGTVTIRGRVDGLVRSFSGQLAIPAEMVGQHLGRTPTAE